MTGDRPARAVGASSRRPLRLLIALLLAVAAVAAAALFLRLRDPERAVAADDGTFRPGGELVASLRSDPTTYNRVAQGGATTATDLLGLLLHARLVRVNRATDALEPMLAESWSMADDGLACSLKLREGIRFSDGHPFTAEDVLFSFSAVYDTTVDGPLRTALQINGKPLDVSAPDPHTVVVRFPEPFGPGLRLLDQLPILPRHKLEAALRDGSFNDQWTPARPVSDVVGLGPFVLLEHEPGQRLVFGRNPHYFRRDAEGRPLPYLDRLTLAIVADQTTETLRLEAGEIDLMSTGDLRPQDLAALKAMATTGGGIRLLDVGVGADPDFLGFNLRSARASDPRAAWLNTRTFRQAISIGVDRQALIDTVYLGEAVPIAGPVTAANRNWFAGDIPVPAFDRTRARELLGSLGLRDRTGDDLLEDAEGRPVRFSIMTQAGHNRERAAAVIQAQLRELGILVDLAGLDVRGLVDRWTRGDYDAMYFGIQSSAMDPWLNPEFWLSSGSFHLWNPRQPAPATPWEARIDAIMREHVASDEETRRRAFHEAQRIFAEELPSIYFVAPKITLAVSARTLNPSPGARIPQLLWSADTLASADAR